MNFMHEIIEAVADELSLKLGRSAEEIRQNGLSAYDFTSKDEVEIVFEDGSSVKFKYSFYVECPGKGLIAVFTEHCGYHLFSSLGAMVSQKTTYSETYPQKKARIPVLLDTGL